MSKYIHKLRAAISTAWNFLSRREVKVAVYQPIKFPDGPEPQPFTLKCKIIRTQEAMLIRRVSSCWVIGISPEIAATIKKTTDKLNGFLFQDTRGNPGILFINSEVHEQ